MPQSAELRRYDWAENPILRKRVEVVLGDFVEGAVQPGATGYSADEITFATLAFTDVHRMTVRIMHALLRGADVVNTIQGLIDGQDGDVDKAMDLVTPNSITARIRTVAPRFKAAW